MNKLKKIYREFIKTFKEGMAEYDLDEVKMKAWIDTLTTIKEFDVDPIPEHLYIKFKRMGLLRQNRICIYGFKARRKIKKGLK